MWWKRAQVKWECNWSGTWSKLIYSIKLSVKFCEHSRMVSASGRFGCHEKCAILCDMKRCANEHTVPCTSNSGFSMILPPPPPPPSHQFQHHSPHFMPYPPSPFSMPEQPGKFNSEENEATKFDKRRDRNGPSTRRTKKPNRTTPSLEARCQQLCRQGNGGKLCRCDLTPF